MEQVLNKKYIYLIFLMIPFFGLSYNDTVKKVDINVDFFIDSIGNINLYLKVENISNNSIYIRNNISFKFGPNKCLALFKQDTTCEDSKCFFLPRKDVDYLYGHGNNKKLLLKGNTVTYNLVLNQELIDFNNFKFSEIGLVIVDFIWNKDINHWEGNTVWESLKITDFKKRF